MSFSDHLLPQTNVWPIPVIVDEAAPRDGVIVTREQLNEAARQIGSGK